MTDEVLELHLLQPSSSVEEHLKSCAACRELCANAEAEGQYFRKFVFPKTIDALISGVEAKRPRLWWAVPALGLALGAVLFTLQLPATAPSDYVGLKGGAHPLVFSIFTLDESQKPIEVTPGMKLKASAPLRFRVQVQAPCYLRVFSLDTQRVVSQIFPAGDSSGLVEGSMALPGGVVLDDSAGPERIFAVCSPKPMGVSELNASVHQISSGAAGVRENSVLEGLPQPVEQVSFLLEKE